MEYIFLDTSIFIDNNFLNNRIQSIFELGRERHIKVILPQITYNEIFIQVEKNIKEHFEKIKKGYILKNYQPIKEILWKKDIENIIVKDIQTKLNKEFEQSYFEIIDYPQDSDIIEEVFDDYFKGEPPFGKDKKKYEFPDAFTLKILEFWAENNGIEIQVFSKDNDFDNLKTHFLHIKNKSDFETFINDKMFEKEMRTKINTYLENDISISDYIENWIKKELNNYDRYYHLDNVYEIYDISINEVYASYKDFLFTYKDKECISIEVKYTISYEVGVLTDDKDTMYKDDDSKEWHFYNTKTIPIIMDDMIKLDVKLFIDNNEIISYEIEDVNKGRHIEIRREYY